MKTKNLIIGAVALAGMALTASSCCGSGSCSEVNADTVFTRQFTDSMSMALGAFMGANGQDEIRYSSDINDYIEGYQLVAGQKFSHEKLAGIRAGLFAADQFAGLEAQGVPVNRALYMQAFRRYLQDFNLPQEEYAVLYKKFQDVINKVDEILFKREEMRRAAQGSENAAITDIEAEAFMTPDEEGLEVVETETESVPDPENNYDSNQEISQVTL